MLAVACVCRPPTLRAFYAALQREDKERFCRAYTADTLYLIARSAYGKDYPLKSYSDLISEHYAPRDTRTEAEITQGIISRLRGETT